MKFDFCQPSFGQVRLNIQQNGRRQQRIAVTFVFILFSLTAVLSVALDVFMELLLEMKINEEMLIAQAALRRNYFFCRAIQNGVYKERHALIGKKQAELNCGFFQETI